MIPHAVHVPRSNGRRREKNRRKKRRVRKKKKEKEETKMRVSNSQEKFCFERFSLKSRKWRES